MNQKNRNKTKQTPLENTGDGYPHTQATFYKIQG